MLSDLGIKPAVQSQPKISAEWIRRLITIDGSEGGLNMMRLAKIRVKSVPNKCTQGRDSLLRCTLVIVVLAFGAAWLTGCRTTQRPVASRDWDQFVADYLESYFAAHPDIAVAEGRHEFDGQLPDWSKAGLDREVARLHSERARAVAWTDNLDQKQRFEREYVIAQIDSDLFWLESARWPYRDPFFYTWAVDPQVYLTRPYAPLDQRMRAFISYEKVLPRALEQIRANLRMTVSESEKMFRESAFADAGNARQQAARGTFDSAYLNYTMGKLMIRKLRDEWTATRGGRDAWRNFHDQFLSFGGPPIPLVRKAMLGSSAGPPL